MRTPGWGGTDRRGTGVRQMIRVSVNDLEPGMVLAAPIPHPQLSDMALLEAGKELAPDMIPQLRRHHVRSVWIRHPGFADLDGMADSAAWAARQKLYYHVHSSFKGILTRTKGAFEQQEYRAIVSELILGLVVDKGRAPSAERIIDEPEEMFAHSENVAYLSLVIGLHLRDYIIAERKYVKQVDALDLTNLGVGGVLHDLGKLGLHRKMRRAHIFEEPDDVDAYRSHPGKGYKALRGRVEATAAAIVLHHHQRFDGEGFPKPKRRHKECIPGPIEGRRIHIFTRIVAVANAIDALISASRRRNRPAIAALAALRSPALEGRFDPVVVDAALRCFPPFVPGSCVTLSDDRPAVVVAANPKDPCRPRVRLMNPDAPFDDPAGKDVDLAEPDAPFIAREGGRAVSKYLYGLPEPSQPGVAEAAEVSA